MPRNERGFILLISWLTIMGLLVVTQSLLARSTTELLAANRSVALQQAFHLAEAGVEETLMAMNSPGGLTTWPTVSPCENAVPCKERALTNFLGGDIRIRVFNWNTGEPRLVVTGSRSSIDRRLEVVLRKQGQVLPFAAFATQSGGIPGIAPSVSVGPALIDSYDSRLGSYGALLGGGSLNKFYDQAKVGTNQDQADPASPSIRLDENAQVWGDASVLSSEHVEVVNAAGASLRTCAPGSSCIPQVNGSVVGLAAPQDFPEIPVPTVLVGGNLAPGSSNLATASVIAPGAYDAGNNPTNNCFEIYGGRTVTLQGGTPDNPSRYRFACLQNNSGSFTIPPNTAIYLTRDNPGWNALYNGDTMTAQGKTEIYFHGRINLPFQPIINSTQKPQDVVFYGVWAGGVPRPDFYLGWTAGATVSQIGVVYMPKGWGARIWQTGELFGAVVDGKAESTSIYVYGPLHYDVALRDGFGLGSGQFKIVSWRELP